jgi:hypothetical protein
VQTDENMKRMGQRNLPRHKSGSYYGRRFAAGKEVWEVLGTPDYKVARAKSNFSKNTVSVLEW